MRPLVVLAVYLLTSTAQAEELRILAWNVESDGNNPNVIVHQLHELSGYDIVGLTEVRASSIKKHVDALSTSGNTFLSINTATGGRDSVRGCRWHYVIFQLRNLLFPRLTRA